MSSIQAVSTTATYHVGSARSGGSRPAAPPPPVADDPDHDGDHDAPGRVDVEA